MWLGGYKVDLLKLITSYLLLPQRVRMRLSVFDSNHHYNIGQMRNHFGVLMFTRRWSKKGANWFLLAYRIRKIITTSHTWWQQYTTCEDKILFSSQGKLTDEEDQRRLARSIAKLLPENTNVLADKLSSRF